MLVELRRIEAEREAAQLEHAQQLARLEIADVQDARDNARDDRVRRILAPLFILMPGGILAMILWVQPAAELLSAAVLVLGLAIANAERVGNFLFGTSLGSKKKQEDIAGVLRR